MGISCGEFDVGTRVAGGSFGDVYIGRHEVTGQHAAIKLEKVRSGNSTSWSQEVKMYRCVTPHPGVPALLWSGTASDGRRGLALELLGPSLDDLFNALERSISIPTLCACAVSLIDRIQWLHSRGIVHRDVKPQNFLCGRIALHDGDSRCWRPHVAFSPCADDIFVVDFGLAKAFNTRSGHVQFKRHQGRAGTARYASINTHKGHVQSRRDDLEAIGYMLVFLHRGRLPWQGVKASSRRQKHRLICAVKSDTPLAELCEGLPHAFVLYIEYARRLGFAEQPNYEHCKSLFEAVLLETPCTRPDWAALDPEDFACISALAASPRLGSVSSTALTSEPRVGCAGSAAAAEAPQAAALAAGQAADSAPAASAHAGRARSSGALPHASVAGPQAGAGGKRPKPECAASPEGERTPPAADGPSCSVKRGQCEQSNPGSSLPPRTCSPRRTRSHQRQRIAT